MQLEIPATCGCQPCSDSMEYHADGKDLIDVRLQRSPQAMLIRETQF